VKKDRSECCLDFVLLKEERRRIVGSDFSMKLENAAGELVAGSKEKYCNS
jgi:hypothetical protein